MVDIGELFLFEGLSDNEKERIIGSLCEVEAFERGETIYDPVHFRRSLGVFLSGKGYSGDENAVKASFTEGDVFGAAALFGAGETYVSRITAKTSCRVLFISEDDLRIIITNDPLCGINYIRFLSDRIRYLNRKIAQYTLPNADERLYRLLCDMADETGRVENVNMSFLAQLSGMGRTSLYRALSELEEKGLVEKENKTIYVRSK